MPRSRRPPSSKPPPERVFFRYNTHERYMVMRAGVRLFMLIGRHRYDVLARNLVQTLPRILAFIETHEPPFIARVYRPSAAEFERGRPGRVDLWLSHADWARSHREP